MQTTCAVQRCLLKHEDDLLLEKGCDANEELKPLTLVVGGTVLLAISVAGSCLRRTCMPAVLPAANARTPPPPRGALEASKGHPCMAEATYWLAVAPKACQDMSWAKPHASCSRVLVLVLVLVLGARKCCLLHACSP